MKSSSEVLNDMLVSIVDNTTAVIYVKDLAGKYLFANRRFEDLLHVSHGQIVGKKDTDLFPKEQAETIALNDSAVIRERRAIELDESVMHDDGVHQYISLKFPLMDSDGCVYSICGISTDVTLRKQSEAQLRDSLSLLQAALESTADGLLVVDRDGHIVRFNGRFANMWQIPDEILRLHADDQAVAFVLNQLENPEEFLNKVRLLYSQPEKTSFDTLHFKDGRVFERYSQPQLLAGEIIGRVWSFRDVTDRVRAERQRDLLLAEEKSARASAEAAVRQRDEFLSVASHELRTPLTSLRLAAQALERLLNEGESDRARRTVALVIRQVKRLGLLVDMLLEVSRIEAGRLELSRSETDLVDLVQDVTGQIAEEAARAGSVLELHTKPPVVGCWDALRLEQAVANLVTNAVKFGRGKPIEIDVAAAGDVAQLTVKDHGIGISTEAQSHLFERFFRNVSARSYGGLGLGLYIVRTVVEAHNGRVSVESEVGQGSVFRIELPISRVDERQHA